MRVSGLEEGLIVFRLELIKQSCSSPEVSWRIHLWNLTQIILNEKKKKRWLKFPFFPSNPPKSLKKFKSIIRLTASLYGPSYTYTCMRADEDEVRAPTRSIRGSSHVGRCLHCCMARKRKGSQNFSGCQSFLDFITKSTNIKAKSSYSFPHQNLHFEQWMASDNSKN